MQDVHIGVPELEERNLSHEEFFRVMIVMIDHELHYLEELYPGNCIDNIKAYSIQFASRILKSAVTLRSVIERD